MSDDSRALLSRVHLFPVRHHSPRTSAVLRRTLERVRPAAVLVEGPSDATPLIDVLVDPGTQPPVAILGYRTDGRARSSLWPFATYSPEYVALAWARREGVLARFIDVPIEVLLARQETPITVEEAPAVGAAPEPTSLDDQCARARGFRSFEEMWEASFEAPDHDEASFRAALIAYAELVRSDGSSPFHAARETYMARQIAAVVASGMEPERVVVVVGAAHAAAFATDGVDDAADAILPAPVAVAMTIIPYSFPRLAEQLGYGAGNRAPQYYQRAHDAGCDFRRATLEVLVEFTEHLRLRGYMASLADTIEAYRLAVALAGLRGKAEPGLDEVREASIATMCRGDATHVDGFLWPSVIGRRVGKVTARVGRNSLQEEFWRELKAHKLPADDAPESFVLKLNDEVQVATSVFLHRLRVASIPYASYQGQRVVAGSARSAPGGGGDEAGGQAALARVRETWEAQWTPSTDIALVERIVRGESLAAVTTRLLDERLAAARSTGEAADVLLESVVTATPATTVAALAACERLASSDDDLPSLARACRALSGLVAYGSSRARSTAGDEALPALCRKTFDRAVLRVEAACTVDDQAVGAALEALRTLHEIALSQPLVDRDAWLAAARALVASFTVHASASGMACGLLYLSQGISDDEVLRVVELRLTNLAEPGAAAAFLEGFLSVNALVLVRSRPVVAALDAFLAGLAKERFRDALPVLRRAFAGLGATERRYLLENVAALRELGGASKAAAAVIAEQDKAKLQQLSDELGDLDDLL